MLSTAAVDKHRDKSVEGAFHAALDLRFRQHGESVTSIAILSTPPVDKPGHSGVRNHLRAMRGKALRRFDESVTT